ncbi:SGNH/GDSL hydrolase family protein [Pseudomonas tohonis]|uniref:SGNH hydrolase-type esterase domain-containing protein n=1 Tax=Pseudomonas tohonis TaxID=2725477 RepID=A0ABQ4VS58_9PSED|nr:SGNH/GDSL hydrolase family protein [Pseudomonas tohonis]GJN50547.1 hypothetical protein TUM20286_02990 [Pseudomonas tohonis]
MSRGAGLLWWASALALMPLVLPQALYTRRTALRLPPAAGPDHGLAGAEYPGEPLRVLLIGESTVAGVGVSCLQLALPGQLATALSLQLQRPVAWRACGENGITAGEACERLLPQVRDEPVDLLLLVFGVNDTTHFSSTRDWRESLRRLASPFIERGTQVVFAAVPPLQHFSALPWLLRRLLGWRARLLDEQMRTLAGELDAEHCAASIAMQADFLAVDGYHPSQLGCRVWGGLLAEWIVRAGRVGRADCRLLEEAAGA